MYKKGTYVVLLSTCNGDDENWEPTIPIYHCYKLKRDSYEDYRGFGLEMDMGGNDYNGWSTVSSDDVLTKTKFRLATKREIEKYERNGGPYKVDLRFDKMKKLYESNKD